VTHQLTEKKLFVFDAMEKKKKRKKKSIPISSLIQGDERKMEKMETNAQRA